MANSVDCQPVMGSMAIGIMGLTADFDYCR